MSGTHSILSLALLLSGCGGGPGGPLAVTPGAPRVVVGESLQLMALDDGGEPVDARWTSSNPAAATVTPIGRLEGVAPGKTTLTASAGGRMGTASVTVLDGGVVTSAGGRVTALSGRVSVEVPAGAVSGPTALAISAGPAGPLDPRVVEGSSIELALSSPLLAPAVLELGYDATRGPVGLAAGSFGLASRDGDGWSNLAASQDDASASRVRAPFTAAGVYVVRQASPTTPCEQPGARQFDFWVGRWAVTFDNQPEGRSEVTLDALGCSLEERFTSGSYVGRSVSFFQPASTSWHQTYVDNAGARVLLSGTAAAGQVSLSTGPGRTVTRLTWLQAGATVIQRSETSRDDGATFTRDFEATYTPLP